MATFEVGQRVRKVALAPTGNNIIPIGSEGVIAQIGFVSRAGIRYQYRVTYDCLPAPAGANSEWIAPLTDPKADAFLESIRKLKPYEEPKVQPDPVVALDEILRDHYGTSRVIRIKP